MEEKVTLTTINSEEEQQPKKFKLLKVIILLLILLFSYMFYFNSFLIKVKEYSITDENLPASFDGLKIVQISDLHYGTAIKETNLKIIIKKINELKPDIIVFTGDLIDKSITHSEKIKSELIYHLSTLEAKDVKLAIKGDNDTDDFADIITNSGFTYLNDEEYPIYSAASETISILGLNNSTSLKATNYQIALLHEPDKIDNLINNDYNLVLAGHTHGGEIKLPFIGGLITYPNGIKYRKNTYEFAKTKMYITDGLGTSGINLRLGTNPTINFYRLYQY